MIFHSSKPLKVESVVLPLCFYDSNGNLHPGQPFYIKRKATRKEYEESSELNKNFVKTIPLDDDNFYEVLTD